MISEELQEQASSYALGILSPDEKLEFEKKISRDPELRRFVEELGDISARLPVAFSGADTPETSIALKDRIMGAIEVRESLVTFGKNSEAFIAKANEAVVVTDNLGFIQWANPAFTVLCGYELHELRGKKPSQILQGALTDPVAVQRIRDAVRSHKPWTEELVNYAKGGTPYWVSISISPILDEHLAPRCFVAIEHEITDRAVA
jgi:PAS domain S-box-containing protein